MRIIAGHKRGLTLLSPTDDKTRPTSDRARESLFNILQHLLGGQWDQQSVLDVFSGTGAFGLESLSRGASSATFIENYPPAVQCLRQNILKFGAPPAQVIVQDAQRPLPSSLSFAPFSVVFLDPPYLSGLGNPTIEQLRPHLMPQAWLILETHKSESILPPAGFTLVDQRTYGLAQFSFFR